MIKISHRGNINGKIEPRENEPGYIDLALNKGYDVEIDIWCIEQALLLGHDSPQYKVELSWLVDRMSKLWIHCKNIDSVVYFKRCNHNFNYFWQTNSVIKNNIVSYKIKTFFLLQLIYF